MHSILKTPVSGKTAWQGKDLNTKDDWTDHLSADFLEKLDAALVKVKEKGLSAPDFAQSDFDLSGFESYLDGMADELENGRGFILLRGLPADRYSEQDLAILYYGIGLHLGRPVAQNTREERLGIVAAVADPKNKKSRVYETNSYLPYHSDLSDVVGLLSVRKAKVGGLSSIVSVAGIYNQILTKYPEYLGLFYKPFYFHHMGEELPTPSPIFSYHAGKLTCRYMRQYIELGHELRGVPLSRVETEALDIFDSVLDDPTMRLDMMMEPGDIQFVNNYSVLHSRTGFEDYDKPEKNRKLLRLWLKMPNARTLAPEFPGRNGFTKDGFAV